MKNNIKTLVIVFVFSIFNLTTFASNPSGEENLSTLANPGEPGVDPGVAPINDYLIPMLLVVFIYVYKIMVKKEKSSI